MPALAQLRALAGKSLDPQLVLLTQRAGEADSVAKVVKMVDKLIATLEKQADEDLKNKEECESERARLTREAKVTSQAMDDLTDEITRAKEKVKEIIAQMSEQDEIIAKSQDSIKDITRQREDENMNYKAQKVDDLKAVELVGEALTILKEMQKKLAGGSLLDVHKHNQHAKQPVEVVAGEAPPPPPATWDAPYGGAEGETVGVVSLLELIEADIQKDIKAADKEEEDAAAAFKVEKGELDQTIQAAKDANNEYTKAKSEAEKEAVEKGTERGAKKGELDSTMKEIDALMPGCDFLLVNFEARLQKRTIEIDGLKKAKLILESAKLQ
jgi:chromosome segregation ATPase